MVNFSFVHQETRKFGPQRIMVKSSKVSYLSLSAVYCLKVKILRNSGDRSSVNSRQMNKNLQQYRKVISRLSITGKQREKNVEHFEVVLVEKTKFIGLCLPCQNSTFRKLKCYV